MARANLNSLLGNLDLSDAPMAPSPSAGPVGAPVFVSTESADAPARVTFDQLERKEARVREDQLEGLSQLARRLNRARPKGAARITDNTLIRVAIDLLLQRAGELRGADEKQIRESLGW